MGKISFWRIISAAVLLSLIGFQIPVSTAIAGGGTEPGKTPSKTCFGIPLQEGDNVVYQNSDIAIDMQFTVGSSESSANLIAYLPDGERAISSGGILEDGETDFTMGDVANVAVNKCENGYWAVASYYGPSETSSAECPGWTVMWQWPLVDVREPIANVMVGKLADESVVIIENDSVVEHFKYSETEQDAQISNGVVAVKWCRTSDGMRAAFKIK